MPSIKSIARREKLQDKAMLIPNGIKNIQNVCNERGIEIFSPHYRAQRDEYETTIPEDYRAKDYKPPGLC